MTVRRTYRVLGCTLMIALTACAPTARTAGPYTAKAVKTADAMHSAVASDLLLLDAVRKAVQIFLGILTAIGGFVDIGELVTGSQVGARFGLNLAWATLLSLAVIVVFAEMAGRVAAVSGRPVFDLVRERLGPRLGVANLIASFVITGATVAAEIGGVALTLELASSINYLLWVPVVAALVWIVIWRVNFEVMENVFGLLGLALIVSAIAVWQFGPDWSHLLHQVVSPAKPHDESLANYLYFAIAMFGAGVMPYEVFFFSSGAVEEG